MSIGEARAQVVAGGLGTRVNGSVFGQCRVGSCAISGGRRAGDNLFHRLSLLDTRQGVRNIRIDTKGLTNVFLGVTNPAGAFLNKTLDLSARSNLFLLAPGGLWLGPGAGIGRARDLLLTTAGRIRLGEQTFDVLGSTDQQVSSLTSKPFIDADQLNNPAWDSATLGLAGNATIEFAGGQITVDRHLLVAAPAGLVVASGDASAGHQPSLMQAGRSVRVQAQSIDLDHAAITAGTTGAWGLVDLRSNGPTQPGQGSSIALHQTQLKGRQIFIGGGEIRIDHSRLEAPKGWIQIKASDLPGLKSNLSISASVLDVSPHNVIDLAMPPISSSAEAGLLFPSLSNRQARFSYPQIGLFSDGNLTITASSTLNASLDLAKIAQANLDGRSIDWQQVADRSGMALLAAQGRLTINDSTITADASHTMAGRILLLAQGGAGSGGVTLSGSSLVAREGAGAGEIIIRSNDGISLNNITFDVSNDRFPLVNGVSSGVVAGESLPYSFYGGRIRLENKSGTAPISVTGSSNVIARSSTSGGPLASPLLSIPQTETNDIGRYGNEDAFSIGYRSFFSGTRINFYSESGISIVDSRIDASSGASQPEAIGGSIGLIDNSKIGIEMRNSEITSRTGTPLDSTNQDSLAGLIRIATEGDILVDRSLLSVQNNNLQDVLPSAIASYNGIPWLTLFTETGLLTLTRSTLEAGYLKDPTFGSSEFIGINIYSGSSRIESSSFNPDYIVFKDVFSTSQLSTFITESNSVSVASAFSSYNSAGPAQVIAPVQVPVFLEPFRLNALTSNTQSLAPNAAIQEDNASDANALITAQEQSLAATIRSLGLRQNSGRVRSIPELQQKLNQARQRHSSLPSPGDPRQTQAGNQTTSLQAYVPAIIHLQREELLSGNIRITAILLTGNGQPISRSSEVQPGQLQRWIRTLQRQFSRRSPPSAAADHAAEQLSQALLGPLLPLLHQQGITALLLEVDRGLQAIPYGALPIEGRPLADRYALTITPSLGLIELDPTPMAQRSAAGRLLLAGASQFSQGLAALPMVRQELQGLASQQRATILLDEAFTPAALLQQVRATDVDNLHIATHASFLPGQVGLLYTPTATITLAELGSRLRSRSSGDPLELISLSGCLTALGDEQSELGFVGMALQAGARSGLGTLWEVDDTATAAFFIQLYRYLNLGLPKDQALQATHRAFLQGAVRLEGDRLVGPDQLSGSSASTLVNGIPREQQMLLAHGLRHPYYWAGMVLTGSPW